MEPAAAGLWRGGGGKKGSGLMCRIIFVSSDNYGRGKVAVSKKKKKSSAFKDEKNTLID